MRLKLREGGQSIFVQIWCRVASRFGQESDETTITPPTLEPTIAISKLYYWNRPWPGHIGFCIDLEAMAGGPAVPSDYFGYAPLGATGLGHYVSWTAGGVIGIKAVTGIKAYARTYEEDIATIGRPADKMIEIPGLDIQAMKQEWVAIRTKQGATWSLLAKSCAVVALRVMRAGGADALVPSRAKRNPAIITPQAVWIYAKSAARHAAG